ncbi:DUF2732 family protein [Pseudocitrobacter cyperus]|uniref:DUF2732 family protein n=1 Tax=Pseudocitrobacter cyperus TaxID=3112843 RepID=A0ABV0HIH4_9ENTR
MRNIHPFISKTDSYLFEQLLRAAKNEERQARALAVSIRLEALATYITQEEMNGKDAASLLLREAVRFRNESLELH